MTRNEHYSEFFAFTSKPSSLLAASRVSEFLFVVRIFSRSILTSLMYTRNRCFLQFQPLPVFLEVELNLCVYINEYSKPVITTTHISPKCNAPFHLACYYRLFIYLHVSFLIFPLLLSPVGVHRSLKVNPFCSRVIINPDVKMSNFTFPRPINIVDKVMFLFPKSHPSSYIFCVMSFSYF